MLNKEIINYIYSRPSLFSSYCNTFKFSTRIETRYNPSMRLTCVEYSSRNSVIVKALYNYETAFNHLFKYKQSTLNDGVIINTLANAVKKINISKLSLDEAAQIIERNLVLINKFNEYYKNVQLIQQIEEM